MCRGRAHQASLGVSVTLLAAGRQNDTEQLYLESAVVLMLMWCMHAQGLSGFVGQACRRYDKMDTSAICQYIANTLKAAQSYDLLVLKALLSDMTVSRPTPPIARTSHALPAAAILACATWQRWLKDLYISI